jgi:hypothetical protein
MKAWDAWVAGEVKKLPELMDTRKREEIGEF